MNTIEQLQQWYLSVCDGEWEHACGIKVETLDNPGWYVTIDLKDMSLEDKDFPVIEYGVGPNSHPEDDNWLQCKVEEKTFRGAGGPDKLEEILQCFLDWGGNHSQKAK